MHKFLLPAIVTFSLIFFSSSYAANKKFTSTINSSIISPIKLEVNLSEEMLYRAQNLPKKLSDRNGARLNSGFSGNGFYGDKELKKLISKLEVNIKNEFSKYDIKISDDAETVLNVTLLDAKPNRPTFSQLAKEPNLSHQSFATGGAEIQARLLSPDGRIIGNLNYKNYESDIKNSRYGSTWKDSKKAFYWFAVKSAKALKK